MEPVQIMQESCKQQTPVCFPTYLCSPLLEDPRACSTRFSTSRGKQVLGPRLSERSSDVANRSHGDVPLLWLSTCAWYVSLRECAENVRGTSLDGRLSMLQRTEPGPLWCRAAALSYATACYSKTQTLFKLVGCNSELLFMNL